MTRLKNVVKVMFLKELPEKEQINFLEKEFKFWALKTDLPIFKNGMPVTHQNLFVSFDYIKADTIPLFKEFHAMLIPRDKGVSLHYTETLMLKDPKTVAHMDAGHNYYSKYFKYGRDEIPTKEQLEEKGITMVYRSIEDPTIEFDLRNTKRVLDALELRVRNALQETYDVFLAENLNIFETQFNVEIESRNEAYYRKIQKVEEAKHETT
jgi:hypothetical protein